MKRLQGKLTYANVVATLALFVALAGGTAVAATHLLPKNSVGTAQLKKGAITGAKIKNGSVTGAKLDLSTLATVPSAATAGTATNAGHATSADHAQSATTATTSADSEALGGIPAGGYATTKLETEHVVGAPGEPGFVNGCGSFLGGAGETRIGFYKDPSGVVHLRGIASGCTEAQSIFTLPAGFRPKEIEDFLGGTSNTTSSAIEVRPDGEVVQFGTTGLMGLTAVSFRTDE